MAGDWLPIRDDIEEDPATLLIAATLSIDVENVVAKLRRVWAWAGRHTTTGRVRAATLTTVDTIARAHGFGEAMRSAEWLLVSEDGGLIFPHWARWNGKSAKKRLLTARRVARFRERKKRDGCNAGNATRAEQSRAKQRRDKDIGSEQERPELTAPPPAGSAGPEEPKTDKAAEGVLRRMGVSGSMIRKLVEHGVRADRIQAVFEESREDPNVRDAVKNTIGVLAREHGIELQRGGSNVRVSLSPDALRIKRRIEALRPSRVPS